MSEPFIGEIRPFSFEFTPRYWAPCNGQLLSIAQNQALFSVLGTTWGGNGTTTFALPNLQERVALHPGTGSGIQIALGQVGGESMHTLLLAEIPTHGHVVNCQTAPGTLVDAANGFFAASALADGKPKDSPFAATADAKMNAAALAVAGGSQPHENKQPYCAVNYCIALQGIYPSRG